MIEYFNLAASGINTYQSPLQTDGQLIHANNVVGFPYGGFSKRPGYGTFLPSMGAQVQSLFAPATGRTS